ncbi:MAG: hypothetical protein QHI38_01960 [Armatimonadota bacterium]|nr:hypothetical protein [Armatimonadota bacterium]
MAIKAGDRVTVVSRSVTAEDQKSGLYYAYFGGLTGRVERVYPDGSVCVDVDLESLSEEARKRHLAIQESEQQRWLEGLSDDVRSRLTPEQRQLKMSYRILVSKEDLRVLAPGKSSEKEPKKQSTPEASAKKVKGEQKAQTTQSSKPLSEKETKSARPRRLSEADLAAAEEAYLRSLRPRA